MNRISLEGQWLGLRAFTAEDVSSIPSQRAKIPHALPGGPPKKKKKFFLIYKFKKSKI